MDPSLASSRERERDGLKGSKERERRGEGESFVKVERLNLPPLPPPPSPDLAAPATGPSPLLSPFCLRTENTKNQYSGLEFLKNQIKSNIAQNSSILGVMR